MVSHRSYFARELRPVALVDGTGGRRDRHAAAEVIALGWNPPANRIAASKTDRSVRIWKLQGTEPTGQLPVIIDSAHERPVESLSWDPHVEINLATVGNDSFVRIWNTVRGRLITEIDTSEKKNFIVKHSGDARCIAAVSKENAINIIDTGLQTVVHRLQLEIDVYSITWNNTSSFLFVGLGNGTVRVYKFAEKKLNLIHTLTGHRSSIKSLKFDPRAKVLLVGSNEGIVSAWSLDNFGLIRTFGDVDEPVYQIDTNRDTTYISVTFEDGAGLRIYDLTSGEELFKIEKCSAGKQTFPVFNFCPIKSTYAYSTHDGTVYIATKNQQ